MWSKSALAKQPLLYGLYGLAIVFVLLAIYGGVSNHNDIPYWDMWDGHIGFYQRISAGETIAWWDLHNQHRLTLNRVLFWLDLHWLQGSNWLLIGANYLFLALESYLFAQLLVRTCHAHGTSQQLAYCLPILIIWLWFWGQYNNLASAFQGQFFMVQLLPLSAFYMLYLSQRLPPKATINLWFWLSVIAGIAANFAMANGLFALPLLALQSHFLTTTRWQKLILWLLTFTSLFLSVIFSNGQTIDLSIIFHSVWQAFYFFVLYLGNPFYQLFGKTVAASMGFIAGVLALYQYLLWCRQKNRYKLGSVSLAMLTYLLLSGLAITIGRIEYGFAGALVSRYTTPTLALWVCLGLLYYRALVRAWSAYPLAIKTLGILLIIALLYDQSKALYKPVFERTEHELSALAIALSIKDHSQLRKIHPVPHSVWHNMQFAADAKLGAFARPDLHFLRRLLPNFTTSNHARVNPACLWEATELHEQKRDGFYRVQAHFNTPSPLPNHQVTLLLNNSKQIIGAGLTLSVNDENENENENKSKQNIQLKGYKNTGDEVRYVYPIDHKSNTQCSLPSITQDSQA